MQTEEFKDEKTGKCKYFKTSSNEVLEVDVSTKEMYEYYNGCPCYKHNVYAEYSDFCAKELCLYWKPYVMMCPPDQEGIAYLTKEEALKRHGK